MLQLFFGGFHLTLHLISIIRKALESAADDAEGPRKDAVEAIASLKEQCNRLGLTESQAFIKRFPIYDCTSNERFSWLLEAFTKQIENEAGRRYCYVVDKVKAETLEAETSRWSEIGEKFPSTQKESESALTCYAINQNTACVFHLMRIAEIGLRALAKDRRVTIPRKPIAWAEWNEIINHIAKSVDLLRMKKRGPKKDEALDFYQGILGELSAFKDVYRNVVMHVRKDFDEHEAASALLHVREFMQRLSTRIKESASTPLKWGRF